MGNNVDNNDWAFNTYRLRMSTLLDRPFFHQETKQWRILLILDDTLNYTGHIPQSRTSEVRL
jgi:hypothetical protein